MNRKRSVLVKVAVFFYSQGGHVTVISRRLITVLSVLLRRKRSYLYKKERWLISPAPQGISEVKLKVYSYFPFGNNTVQVDPTR